MGFRNTYADAKRAETYSKLQFPGTYYLAYRDIPRLIAQYVKGNRVMDFGCGTGRSTRFLKQLGFSVTGIDISQDMIKKAQEIDPEGDYRLITKEGMKQFGSGTYDLILSAFTFDNIPTEKSKVTLFKELARLLKSSGVLINLVSSPEIYTHEWASFSTKDYPGNKQAKSGDTVRIIITATEDKRPVEDIFWTPESYRETIRKADLRILEKLKPLAKKSEPYAWVNETNIAPWTIYVLKRLA